MAAKSFINLCTALTMSRFCAEIVLRDCPEPDPGTRKIRRTASRIVEQVMAARGLWPPCTDPKDILHVEERCRVLGSEILHGERQMEELIGVALAMLDDMAIHLRSPRREAVEALTDSMQRLLADFDRNGEAHEAYRYAGEKVGEWYQANGMEV